MNGRRDVIYAAIIAGLAVGWLIDRSRLAEEIERRENREREGGAAVDEAVEQMRGKMAEVIDKIEKRDATKGDQ